MILTPGCFVEWRELNEFDCGSQVGKKRRNDFLQKVQSGSLQNSSDAPSSWPLNVFFGEFASLPPCDMTLELRKGDVLLIPLFWWHEVEHENEIEKLFHAKLGDE